MAEMRRWGGQNSQYAALLAYLGYRQAGRDTDAARILDEAMSHSNVTMWPGPILRYYRKEMAPQALLALATDKGRETEAHTYVGMELSRSGRHAEALEHLRWVRENGERGFIEYSLALVELRRTESLGCEPICGLRVPLRVPY